MAAWNHATVSGRGLGGELRRLRTEKRLSTRRVAEQLGWQASKISRMETGKQGIRVEDVASLLVVYGVTGDERRRLLTMAERSPKPGWWETAGALSAESKTLMQLEAETTHIFDFEPLLVPGLLQTPDYTRAVMKSGGVADPDAEVRVAARLARQAILSRSEPPELHVVLDEMVLRRVLGSPRTMARQLRHLMEMTEEGRVRIQVLPFALGGHGGLDGSFVIMSFSHANHVAYLDHKISGLFLEETEQITLFQKEADNLCRVALSHQESADLLADLARELECC